MLGPRIFFARLQGEARRGLITPLTALESSVVDFDDHVVAENPIPVMLVQIPEIVPAAFVHVVSSGPVDNALPALKKIRVGRGAFTTFEAGPTSEFFLLLFFIAWGNKGDKLCGSDVAFEVKGRVGKIDFLSIGFNSWNHLSS